ncbi:MAG: aminoglycoside phosphotransferase family protein [Chloroflexia bacterium]
MTAPGHPPDYPPEFIHLNAADPAWLDALPDLLASLAARWSLTIGHYFPGIRYNYVAPATRADGTPCVLKVSRHGELPQEIAALRIWAGDGAVRVLESDPALGALLLEQLQPGTMLSTVAAADDDAATTIAADILRRLWRPIPAGHGLRSLESGAPPTTAIATAILAGIGGFPVALFRRADALRHDLLASTTEQTVLHGDLHHFNILRAQRAPWLAIDPKGLAGDRCFDICQFLRNPHPGPIDPALNRRRLDIFCAELRLDRERTKAWCVVHAVLDACWDYEEGEPWAHKVAYAEETQSF